MYEKLDRAIGQHDWCCQYPNNIVSTFLKGSLATLVRGLLCDLKITGSSHEISHWKQVRPPIIHPSRYCHSPNPAYAGCFVHWATLFIVLAFPFTCSDHSYVLLNTNASHLLHHRTIFMYQPHRSSYEDVQRIAYKNWALRVTVHLCSGNLENYAALNMNLKLGV